MKKRFYLILISVMLIASMALLSFASGGNLMEQKLKVENLKTDNLINPLGIDSETPVFSWNLNDPYTRGQKQTAYRVTVALSEGDLANGIYVWDSGKVESDETTYIKYEGTAVEPSSRYFWQVEVFDKDGVSVKSDVAFFETGLMDSGWSDAKWIGRSDFLGDAYSELTSFKIELKYTMKAQAVSLLFGASGSSNFYMWQISAYGWHTDYRLRPQKCTAGVYSELSGVTLENDQTNVGTAMTLTVEVTDGTVKTYHNGVLKDTRTIEGLVLGCVGFRRSGTESYAVDSIKVSDGNGSVVFEEDFTTSNGNFAGIQATNGVLDFNSSVANGIILRTSSGEIKPEGAPMLRREFSVSEEKTVEKARLYITSAGVYRAFINGVNVTDAYLNPGMNAYGRHIMYQTYDVTDLINKGGNAIGAYLGHGWWNRALRNFGSNLYLYAKLVVDYTDGSSDTVVTDDSWRFYRYGPIIDDDLFNGFKFDGTVEKALEGWNKPDYDDSEWDDVYVTTINKIVGNGRVPTVIAQNIPLIKNTITLDAIKMTEPKEGVYVYDFGQNIAGVVRVTATAPAGTTIKLRHAESLNYENMQGADDEPGMIFRANLPRAEATDTYVFKGDPNGETFEPFFTYHGFRYVEITGVDEPLPLEDVKALLLMSDLPQTSTFESSHALINRLYLNSLWSARDNFMSVPTDCPQRGERFGWTGDAQIFARTGSYMMDVNAFYQKYCMDIRDTSTNNRIIADVAPASAGDGWYGQGDRNEATNGFGDAIAIIPYQIYKQYGNKAILEENYVTMCNWMDYLISTSTDYIRDESWTGDWMCVNEKKSPVAVTDTAYCAYTAYLISEIAEVLGKTEDVAKYTEIYNNYRNAWRENFLEADGCTTKCGTQTSYVLGLKFGLFDEDERAGAAENLVNNIKSWDWHLSTGFLGYSFLNPILSDFGKTQTAYRLLEQTEYPSSLYSVTMGATTIWESWYVMRRYEDGSISVNEESQNHFSYGSVSEWLFRYMLGIDRDDENSVAFKHFLLKPEFGGTITYAKGSYDSIRGTIKSEWNLDKDTGAFEYSALVPANTTATLYLPAQSESTVITEGGIAAENAEGVTLLGYEDGCMIYELESGSYAFESTVEAYENTVTSIELKNSQGVAAVVTVKAAENTEVAEFPKSVDVIGSKATVVAVATEEGYAFSHFLAKDGTAYNNGDEIRGDVSLELIFDYTGTDDGTDDKKTITLTGDATTEITVNGEAVTLPYTSRFDKGTEVAVKVTKVAVGKELTDIGGVKCFDNSITFKPLCDITANINTQEALYREGFDVFFGFEHNIGLWNGMSVSLTHEPDYMVFKAVEKAEGGFDPRAYYNFAGSTSSVTGGEYLEADKYEKLVIGFIADKVAANSTPYLYISTEAQPSYVNPVRGKGASSAITTDMADGKTLRTVEFSLSDWKHWTGNIKHIYLDILDNVDGSLRVDYIKLKCRDLRLTVKKDVTDEGVVTTYTPGTTVDLTQFETEEDFLGYSLEPGSDKYITEVVMSDDITVYANYKYDGYNAKVWSFDDNTVMGWNVGNVAEYSVTDGILKANMLTNVGDAQLEIAVDEDASVYKYVAVDMRHNIPAGSSDKEIFEVFFKLSGGKWAQNCSVNTALASPSDSFNRYVVDLSTNDNYSGTVSALRIDPVDVIAPSEGAYNFEIDNIMFLPEATVVLNPGYTGGEEVLYGMPACIPVSLSACPVPERAGYKFVGWTNGVTDEIITETTFIRDTVLYAKWKHDIIVWDFDDGTKQNWSVNAGVDKGVTDGVYKVAFSKTNADTWLKNTSLSFEAAPYKYIIVYMRHNVPSSAFGTKPFEAFFVRNTDTPWQAHLSANTTQKSASDEFVPYIVDMTKCTYWNGNITHLRLDPFEILSTGDNEYYFEVDKIIMSYDVKLTLEGKEYTVPAGVKVKLSDYAVPTKTGFAFVGWTDGKSDEIITTVTPTEDTSLNAVWTETNPQWNFDDNTTQGWTSNVTGTLSAENGALKVLLHNTNNDVFVYISNQNIDASKYKYAVVYMKHNVPQSAWDSTPFQFLFYNSNSSWWDKMLVNADRKPASTEYEQYVFNMGSNIYWNGTIPRLRFDPFQIKSPNLGDYVVYVDKIVLCPEVKLTFDYGFDDTKDTVSAIPAGVDVTLSDYVTPEREGYKFLGWKNGKDGDIITSVNTMTNQTLYASWKATAPSISLTESRVAVENLETDAVLVLSGYDIYGRLVDTVTKPVSGSVSMSLASSGLDIFKCKTVKAFLFNDLEKLSPMCREKSVLLYMFEYEELENEQYGFMGRWFDYKHSDGNTYKATITPGAEMFFKVSGTTKVNFKLNCNSNLHDVPYIAVSVDGSKPVRIATHRTNAVTIADGLNAEKEHIIRIIVDSFSSSQGSRWTEGNGLIFDKVIIDAGGTITGLMPKNPIIAYYGDSITEGLASLSTAGQGMFTTSSSAIGAYPFTASHLVGAVSHTNGYGSTGITIEKGLGNVPNCITVIDNMILDTPIVMPELDAIVINHGHNDLNASVSNEDFAVGYKEVLVRLREKHPDTPILAVVPYAQRYVDVIKSVVEELDDENIYYISTAGWEYTTTDGVHPDAAGGEKLGIRLAEEIAKILK